MKPLDLPVDAHSTYYIHLTIAALSRKSYAVAYSQPRKCSLWVLYACACCLIHYKQHVLASILQLQSESSVNCDCKRLPRNRCGSLQLVDYVCKTIPTRHTILIVYYIKSCCSVILENPRLWLKSPYYYHFQLFFPSEHACMSASVCWDCRRKKGATFFFPAVYFSSLRQSYLPESKHLSL